MGAFSNENSIEGEIFIQRLSTYIRRHEESLANGLVYFLKSKTTSSSASASGKTAVKPLRLLFTIHHLYYILERIESSTLGVDVGPLNIKLDNPNHEPTFISFMANNARNSKHFESDARSISSINSMKSIVSSASMYWRSVGFSKDPKVINKDLKYLYSSFTKIPCLILSPKTKMNSISGYEEYPCDTSVPLVMFKNLQVLEIVDYDPNEVFGWHVLSDQLRILIIKNSKISDLAEVIFNLVIDDESGRSSFSHSRQQTQSLPPGLALAMLVHEAPPAVGPPAHSFIHGHRKTESSVFYDHDAEDIFKHPKRERASTYSFHPSSSSLSAGNHHSPLNSKDYHSLPDHKWSFLKQLTISEASITAIPSYIFKPLSSLVKLNLSNNLMETIPEGLDQLTSLKYLNLSDNLLTDLTNLPSNLKNLSTLNLNNNKLVSLDGFNNLTSLEKVDLRRNKLKELSSLKPVVLQFIKNPDKFNNVYLANNLLPKSFRIDLFNLFNGIKYKNNMKIDDSRPGYFESALLLDSDAAFKAFEKFFGLMPETPKSHKTTASLAEVESITLSFKRLDVHEDSNSTIVTHTVVNSATTKTISPLSTNQNLTNLKQERNNTDLFLKQSTPPPPSPNAMTFSTPTPAFLHSSSSSTSTGPGIGGMKKSPTLNQLDLESIAAPGVITPIQVTARMSS